MKIILLCFHLLLGIQLLKGQMIQGVVTYGNKKTPVSQITVKTRIVSGGVVKRTITDLDGKYSLQVDSLDFSLIFSCDSCAFLWDEVKIDKKNEIDVSLVKIIELGQIRIDCHVSTRSRENDSTPWHPRITKIEKTLLSNQNDNISIVTLHESLSDSITFPTLSAEDGISGKVWAEFGIDNDKIINVKIRRGVDLLLDNEVIRAIESIKPEVLQKMKDEYKDNQLVYRICANFCLM